MHSHPTFSSRAVFLLFETRSIKSNNNYRIHLSHNIMVHRVECSPYHFFSRVWYRCMYVLVHVCVGTCVYMCAWKPKVDIICLHQFFSISVPKAVPLTLAPGLLIWLVSLACLVWASIVSTFWALELQSGCHADLAHLYGNYSNHWAISSAPYYYYFLMSNFNRIGKKLWYI